MIVAREDGTLEVREVPAARAGAVIARAEREPGVEYAELDVPLRAVAAPVTPNDPMFPQQWGLARTRTTEAWSRSTGSTSVVIAVVDTGVDSTHPDLAGQLLPGADCITNEGVCVEETATDPNGHGTGVAGVVGARGNDGRGVAGHCWSCRILPVKALDETGAGSAASVGAGIRWAVDHGADIVNLSLAGEGTNVTLERAIADARNRGAIVDRRRREPDRQRAGPDPPPVPGEQPRRHRGRGQHPHRCGVLLELPGRMGGRGRPGCALTTGPGRRYAKECGTSFASPAVAGILGLALAAAPAAPVSAVEAALASTSAPLSLLGLAAAGRVDAATLVDTLAAAFLPPPTAERVAGVDRVSTAVALSRRARASAAAVIVARADSYADALAAAPLAGKLGAPVLLTGSGGLAAAVAEEVTRLGATSAILVGGTGALSAAVAAGLRAAGSDGRAPPRRRQPLRHGATHRRRGRRHVGLRDAGERLARRRRRLRARRPHPHTDPPRRPRRRAGGHLAGAGCARRPKVTVIGGPSVVSDAVVQQLGATRVAGANRYETSAAVAALAAAAGGDASHAWVATGADWPDALAAGPASAADGGVLRLVDGRNGGATAVFAGATSVVVVGGEASVSSAVLDLLSALLR